MYSNRNKGSIVFHAIIGLFIVGALASIAFSQYKRVRLADQQSKYAETAKILKRAMIILSKESLDEDGDSVREAPLWDHTAGRFKIPSTSKAPRYDAWGNELIYCPFDYGDSGVADVTYAHIDPDASNRGAVRVKIPSSRVDDLATAPAFALYSKGPSSRASDSSVFYGNSSDARTHLTSFCIENGIAALLSPGQTANATVVAPPGKRFVEWAPHLVATYEGMLAYMATSGGAVTPSGNKYEPTSPANPAATAHLTGEMVIFGDKGGVYVKSGNTATLEPLAFRGTSFSDRSKVKLTDPVAIVLDGNDNTLVSDGTDPHYLTGSRYAGIFMASGKTPGSLFINVATSDCQRPDENVGYTEGDMAFMCGFSVGRIKEGVTPTRPNIQNNLMNMSPLNNPDIVSIGQHGLIFGSGENSMRFVAMPGNGSKELNRSLSRFEMVKRDLDGNLRTYWMNAHDDVPEPVSNVRMNLPAITMNGHKVFDMYGVLNLPTLATSGATCLDAYKGSLAIDANGDVYVCK